MTRYKILRTVELPDDFPPDYFASAVNLVKLFFYAPLGMTRAIRFCRVYAHRYPELTALYRLIFTVGSFTLIPFAFLIVIMDGIVLALRGRLIGVIYAEHFL